MKTKPKSLRFDTTHHKPAEEKWEKEDLFKRIENLRRRYDTAIGDGMADIWPGYEELWFFGHIKELISKELQNQRKSLIKEIKEKASFEPGVSTNGWYTIYKDDLEKLEENV